MRVIPLALALALVLAAPPALAQTAPRTLGDRDALRGWEAVGRVDMGPGSGADAGFCTGALIAPDLVLTAAHCLFDGASPRNPADIVFRAGLTNGRAMAEARVTAAAAHPAYRPGGRVSDDSVRHDIALMRLASPISTAIAAPFRIDTPAPGDEVSVVSYGRDRSEVLTHERLCRVQGRERALLAFDCDVTFGSSGAPVFQRTMGSGSGRARIVSIVSAGAQGQRLAFGPELPETVEVLKRALASGRGTAGLVQAGGGAAAAPVAQARRIGAGMGIGSGEAGRDIGARFVKPRVTSAP
ncbi:MAG TPA: trypsin-like peptidase domain-containing protein [Paracoccaceae bacterium]|nr:trypsin-like peptidase domain-containing protein [Paracoccaceae bacterium]HMO72182.1 trypsin-like peptidase domain-containing protein [Paracoccaceae bacterium]